MSVSVLTLWSVIVTIMGLENKMQLWGRGRGGAKAKRGSPFYLLPQCPLTDSHDPNTDVKFQWIVTSFPHSFPPKLANVKNISTTLLFYLCFPIVKLGFLAEI